MYKQYNREEASRSVCHYDNSPSCLEDCRSDAALFVVQWASENTRSDHGLFSPWSRVSFGLANRCATRVCQSMSSLRTICPSHARFPCSMSCISHLDKSKRLLSTTQRATSSIVCSIATYIQPFRWDCDTSDPNFVAIEHNCKAVSMI